MAKGGGSTKQLAQTMRAQAEQTAVRVQAQNIVQSMSVQKQKK